MSDLLKTQSAFQRWEMTSFGDERPSAVAARQALAEQQGAARGEPIEEVPMPPAYPTVEELDAIREEARSAGHAEGLEAGRRAGYEEAHAQALAEGKANAAVELAHLKDIAVEFGAAVAGADELIANDVLDLALELARGMLKTALPARPELIVPIVREAIEYLPVLQQPALLMLNPADAAAVREGIGEELEKGGWRVIEDPSIERGGCKIDTASNQIDAQASTRWARLTQALGRDLAWIAP